MYQVITYYTTVFELKGSEASPLCCMCIHNYSKTHRYRDRSTHADIHGRM